MKKTIILILMLVVCLFALLGLNQQGTKAARVEENNVQSETETSFKQAISKDLSGYKVVFASYNDKKGSDIWVSDVDGSNEKRLTGGLEGIDMYPEWSPDAKYIYYTSNKHGGTMELYRVNTEGEAKPQQLSLFGREVRSLSLSADGKYVALGIMSSNVPFGQDLKPYSADMFVVETSKLEALLVEGKLAKIDDLKLLLSEPQSKHIWFEQPDFQKVALGDKAKIAFVRTENYDDDPNMKDEVWTMNVDGSDLKRLKENDSMPRWTVDDKSVVTHEFNVIDVVSGEYKKLKIEGLSPSAGAASISPDGKYVIFEVSDENRKVGLAKVVYQGEGVKNHYVPFTERNAYEPRWSPVPMK